MYESVYSEQLVSTQAAMINTPRDGAWHTVDAVLNGRDERVECIWHRWDDGDWVWWGYFAPAPENGGDPDFVIVDDRPEPQLMRTLPDQAHLQ